MIPQDDTLKVKFHYIKSENMSAPNPYIITVCSVLDTKTNKVSYSMAFCNTEKDQFNKKIGRTIAQGRFNSPSFGVIKEFTGSSYKDFAKVWNNNILFERSIKIPRGLNNIEIIED